MYLPNNTYLSHSSCFKHDSLSYAFQSQTTSLTSDYMHKPSKYHVNNTYFHILHVLNMTI